MNCIDINTLSNKEKMALVCLYYAQLKNEDEKYKPYSENLKLLAEKYNFKFKTLLNNKDVYDTRFDNGRAGWHQGSIERHNTFLNDIFVKYKDVPPDDLAKAIEKIINEAMTEGNPFYSIKTKDSKTVQAISNRESNVEFDGLNIFQDSLKKGQLVFIVFGGDRPPWDTGLAGMGIISKEPYAIGYSGKNFKIRVDMKLLLDKTIKREDLVPYGDTYGIIGIAPIIKWEPNQAISQMSEKSAIALMRAMLELSPSIEKDLDSIVETDMMERIKGVTTKLVPVKVNYKESMFESIKEAANEVKYSEDDAYDSSKENAEEYTKDDFLKDVFITPEEYDILRAVLEHKKNVILQGAPGVGKTFVAKRLAYSILGNKCNNCIKMIQFHQSYSYEDFVTGYRPMESGFYLADGPFYSFCKRAENDSRPYFFIIDEINRGNLSKIFGELLMLIEADKRKETINILYKNEEFSIPENMYIIGMMNTADRGLAMIDYALRRRFAFYEMLPAFDSEKFIKNLNSSCDKTAKLIKSVKELNKSIVSDDALGSGFQIGHSYFCMNRPLTEIDLKIIVEYEIIPLIKEYWFDEPSKIEEWETELRGAIK